MATLEPRADKVVRDAIDAFLDGRLVPEFVGETVFETKNSRYRLLDGVIFAAPDTSLVGAELVGWLCESQRRFLVESAWQPGSRAVLVDRKQGRNIIVTSTTRLLHQEERGSASYQGGSRTSPNDFRSWHPPAPPDTPPPPPLDQPRSEPAERASSEPVEAPKRGGVHLPPRPMATPSAPIGARPLPLPTPPPLRVPAPPRVPPALDPSVIKNTPAPAPTETGEWALTSAELEMVVEDDPLETSSDVLEPVNSDPFPLVRPADGAFTRR